MSDQALRIQRYDSSFKTEWNQFVRTSKNGTFLLERDYMDYHSHRFVDHSLLFYKKNELIALLPAHIQENCFCSHNGLTYGGLIMSDQTTAQLTLDLFSELLNYIRQLNKIEHFIYRPIPSIYHRYPAEEDLYALFRNNAQIIGRKIASVLDCRQPFPFQTLRQRKVKRAIKANLMVKIDADIDEFWDILTSNLQQRYNATPVHTLEEMKQLQQRFPENIHLHIIVDENDTHIAGCIVYETPLVAHIQYIASTAAGKELGAVDLLFDYLIHHAYHHKAYFDLGTSVEEGGHILNEGLIFQKEGFGGRGIVYDTYDITLKQN